MAVNVINSPNGPATGTKRLSHRLSLVVAAAVVAASAQVGAQQQPTAHAPGAPAASTDAARLRRVTTISGTALNSFGGPLAQTAVRLRDTRTGRVVDLQITDKSGTFTFTAVAPGRYIVELWGAAHSVLAASEMILVAAGDAATTVVKLPFGVPPLAGVPGHSASPIMAIIAEAVAAGVLATTVAGSAISPVIP